jgi:hypothetical protein
MIDLKTSNDPESVWWPRQFETPQLGLESFSDRKSVQNDRRQRQRSISHGSWHRRMRQRQISLIWGSSYPQEKSGPRGNVPDHLNSASARDGIRMAELANELGISAGTHQHLRKRHFGKGELDNHQVGQPRLEPLPEAGVVCSQRSISLSRIAQKSIEVHSVSGRNLISIATSRVFARHPFRCCLSRQTIGRAALRARQKS